MSLAYFGSQGMYDPLNASANAQNQLSAANYLSATNTTLGMLGGATLSYPGYGGLASQSVFITNIGSATEALEKATRSAKKKAQGILMKLRDEIEGWHGDILERSPA